MLKPYPLPQKIQPKNLKNVGGSVLFIHFEFIFGQNWTGDKFLGKNWTGDKIKKNWTSHSYFWPVLIYAPGSETANSGTSDGYVHRFNFPKDSQLYEAVKLPTSAIAVSPWGDLIISTSNKKEEKPRFYDEIPVEPPKYPYVNIFFRCNFFITRKSFNQKTKINKKWKFLVYFLIIHI